MKRATILIAAIALTGCTTVRERFDEWRNPPEDPPAVSEFPEGLVWLGADISNWPATATISEVSVRGGTIHFPYSHAHTWPAHPTHIARDGAPMNGNVWIIAEIGGTWYATTWEWLKVGQQSKPVSSIYGEGHLQYREFAGWRPVSGETYYWMVSGFARDRHRTVEERSNAVRMVWP